MPGVSAVPAVAGARSPVARVIQLGAGFAGSTILQAALGFATSIVVARGLGVTAFGIWTLCLAAAATLVAVLDLGFGTLLTRDAARGDPALGKLLGGALAVRLSVLAAASIVYGFWPVRLGAEPLVVPATLGLTAAAIVSSGFAAVLRVRPATFAIAAAIEAAASTMLFAGSWWLVTRGGTIGQLLLLAFASQAAQALTLAAVQIRMGDAGAKPAWPDRSVLARARQAGPVALAGLVANLQARLGPLALGVLSGTVSVAAFGAAARLIGFARLIPHAAFAGALPVLADELRLGPAGAVRGQIDRAILGFALVAAGALALLAEPLVRVVYGSGFETARWTLVWLAAGLPVALANSSCRVFLFASDRDGTVLAWSVIALVLQVAGCLALVPVAGAAGAAVALGAGEVLVWWPLRQAAAARGRQSHDVDETFSRAGESAGRPAAASTRSLPWA